MDTKLFAIKIPENEKIAMDYISKATNNTLSKIFYKPLQEAIFANLGFILLHKIDVKNTTKLSALPEVLFSHRLTPSRSLPIIEDFVSLILDKNLKSTFWKIFGDIQLNEKDFLLHELDINELASYIGEKYLLNHGSLEDLDLNLARNLFFNYMLMTYFNTTALGSIKKLNFEWSNRKSLIKQFQSQLIARYLNRFKPKKLEAIKVDELLEVSEYVE
jgi:hypothetical protein